VDILEIPEFAMVLQVLAANVTMFARHSCRFKPSQSVAVSHRFQGLTLMPLTVSSLERQLKSANANMDAYVATLDGADAKQRKRNPKWRNLQSARLQIESRLRSAKAVVAYTEELDQKRAAASAEE
jgi:hypothetical protein